jgi:hypothetical protein
MKTFRDTAGREWAIVVDVAAVKRVMKAPIEYFGEPLKANLLALVEPDSELLKRVVAYPPLLCDIIYAICQPQCLEKGISDEEFGRAMGGEVLEKVLDLMLEETIDFFPPVRRSVLRKVLEKSRAFAEKARALAETRIAAGELDQALDQALAEEWAKLAPPPPIGSGTATSSPVSSGSIPAP